MKTFTRVLRRVWFPLLVLLGLIAVRLFIEVWIKKHPEFRFVSLKILKFSIVWTFVWIAALGIRLVQGSNWINQSLNGNLRILLFTILRVTTVFLGLLMSLDAIGFSITPLLASLGVGSVAIALALQDTLGNVFSGFYLYLDRPISVGDSIRLESGIDGVVQRIGWRTTRILTQNTSIVIVPNSKLATSTFTNFSLPAGDSAVTLVFLIDYTSDLDRVEQELISIANSLATKSPVVATVAPIIRFREFKEIGVEVGVTVRAKTYDDQGLVRHDLLKAIIQRFKETKIKIPTPYQRVIIEKSGDTPFEHVANA